MPAPEVPVAYFPLLTPSQSRFHDVTVEGAAARYEMSTSLIFKNARTLDSRSATNTSFQRPMMSCCARDASARATASAHVTCRMRRRRFMLLMMTLRFSPREIENVDSRRRHDIALLRPRRRDAKTPLLHDKSPRRAQSVGIYFMPARPAITHTSIRHIEMTR